MSEFINHLWQSTLFAIAAGLLTLAFRNNRASVRYWLWFAASVKFLIPFSSLIQLGSRLQWAPATERMASPAISLAMEQLVLPFHSISFSTPVFPVFGIGRTALVILVLWLCGLAAVSLMRLRVWLRVRAVVRSSIPTELPWRISARSYPGLMEPGVFGIWRPVLLLPSDIQTRLPPQQFEAVVAHELCHIRRRDNLTAAIHMIVESIFWFHPLIWWIGSRMVTERERACDEEVLRLGNEPHVYAEGILNVCKLYLESPLRCMSGVTGSDLKQRIHAIASERVAANLSAVRKMTLAMAAVVAVALPLIVGMVVHAGSPGARQQVPAETEAQVAARNSLNKGVMAFREQRFTDAVELFRKAIELDPNFTSAELYLATAYGRLYVPGVNSAETQKYADMAILSFQNVLQKNPESKEAAAGIAGIYQATSQFDRAREAWLKNVELNPQNSRPAYGVGATDWIIVHNTASSLHPNDRSRLIEEGLQYLDRAISLDPYFEDAFWYEDLLIREKAGIIKAQAQASADPTEQRALLVSASEWEDRADDWANKALEIRKHNQAVTATTN